MKKSVTCLGVLAVSAVMALGVHAAEAPAPQQVGDWVPGKTVVMDCDGTRLSVGGDWLIRFERYDRDGLYGQNRHTSPSALAREDGPDVEYWRNQLRVWGRLDISPDNYFYARMANRFHVYSSRPGTNNEYEADNNAERAVKRSGWAFPDEFIIDNLYWDVGTQTECNGYWNLRLGRQDVFLGNGMIVADPTTGDAARTPIGYMDGAIITWQQEKDVKKSADTLKLLALYGAAKDWMPVINDQDRFIRRGETILVGPYWTHRFGPKFNMDLYALYLDVSNDQYDNKARETTEAFVPGVRFFGDLHTQVGYSVEYSRQDGTMQTQRGQPHQDLTGDMLDARLILRAPKDTLWNPVLTLQYTYFSGNDALGGDANEEYEGWYPVLAEYPMFGGELAAFSLPAGPFAWSNLHQYRVALDLQFNAKWSGQIANSVMFADDDDLATGGGNNIGDEIYGFVKYKMNAWLEFRTQVAVFFPGDFYADGQTCEWIRLETRITF